MEYPLELVKLMALMNYCDRLSGFFFFSFNRKSNIPRSSYWQSTENTQIYGQNLGPSHIKRSMGHINSGQPIRVSDCLYSTQILTFPCVLQDRIFHSGSWKSVKQPFVFVFTSSTAMKVSPRGPLGAVQPTRSLSVGSDRGLLTL